MYNNAPFASWIPKPLMLLLIFAVLFPMMTVSGVYVGSATDTSGAMATYTEYISLANNSAAIGMGMAILIFRRIKMRFRTKEIVTVSSVLLAVLSYMCGTTDSSFVLVAGSLMIGLVKMFPMFEMVLPVMFIITPTGERGKFYSVFYPLSIGFSQLSAYYFATLVFDGSWQTPYMLMSALMLMCTVISLIFQHNQRFSFKVPLYQIDWLSLLLLGGSLMCFNYFFVFMKQQGWFISPYITGTLTAGIILFMMLYYRQKFLKRKMIDFSVFKRANVIHASLLLIILGIYLASSSVYTQYSLGVLGYNNVINAHINLWMIPGIIVAGILAFFGFKNQWPLKYYIASGFSAFFLHLLSLYLMIQPQMDIHYLECAMILKGLGMGILFIGVWFYASLNLPLEQLLGMFAILIALRSFLATAIGSAVIGWAAYHGQWQSLNDISAYLDTGAIPNGMEIYKNISINALMASSKIVLGSLCWMIVPVLILVLTHRYGVFNFRRVILLRKVIRGNSIRGYKF